MKFKKIGALILIFAIISSLCLINNINNYSVGAEPLSFEECIENLKSSYNNIVNKDVDKKLNINVDNYAEYLYFAETGLSAYEIILTADNYDEEEELIFKVSDGEEVDLTCKDVYIKVFDVYKKCKCVYITTLYDESNYSQTSSGTILLHEKVRNAKQNINSAENKEAVDEIVTGFETFIEEDSLSKSKNSVVSSGDISVTVSSKNGELYFNDDTVLIAKEYKSSIIKRNVNKAVENNENCTVEKGGVAYYLNLQLVSDGVAKTEYDGTQNFLISINLESIGLSLGNEEPVQIAVYTENRTVKLLNATIEDGELKFETNEITKFAVITANKVEQGIIFGFFSKYWIIIVAIIIFLFIVIIPIRACRKDKTKKEHREYMKFKKQSNRKIEKSSKKEDL